MMRPTADYATVRGREYRVASYGTGSDGRQEVGFLLDGADESPFDDVTDHPNGRMATVPRDDLERLERVTTTGTVDGAEVTLYGVGDPVPCSFWGDPDWAATHGFGGSQHDGWTGTVPMAEIDDIRESVVDLLHPAGAGGAR